MSVLASHRRRREAGSARFGGLSPAGGPGGATPPPLPVTQAEQAPPTPVAVAGERGAGDREPAGGASALVGSPGPAGEVGPLPAPATPLAQAKGALRQAVLVKLGANNLEPLEGIRLLEAVNATDSIDTLCSLYNRLAGIERQQERARRRRGRRMEIMPVREAGPPLAGARMFSLGQRRALDADAVEGEIRQHLCQRYHRFVSQAVNDMEFGRGKGTSGYPGLWHVSAGVAGVGSCSVFYYADEAEQQLRIAGIGHHVGRAAYRLDYAAGELAGVGRVLCIVKTDGRGAR